MATLILSAHAQLFTDIFTLEMILLVLAWAAFMFIRRFKR